MPLTSKRVPLREWEAAAFAAGRKSMLLRPVRFVGAECIQEREDGTPWLWSPQHDAWVACPLGEPGDGLWGAEAWVDWCPLWKGGWCGHGDAAGKARDHEVYYRADGKESWLRGLPRRWRSSATMPRWASRFVWRVTDVRVVRVGDINEQEAINAGHIGYTTPTALLRQHWRVDFGKRHPWDANPWAWLVGVEAKHERA